MAAKSRRIQELADRAIAEGKLTDLREDLRKVYMRAAQVLEKDLPERMHRLTTGAGWGDFNEKAQQERIANLRAGRLEAAQKAASDAEPLAQSYRKIATKLLAPKPAEALSTEEAILVELRKQNRRALVQDRIEELALEHPACEVVEGRRLFAEAAEYDERIPGGKEAAETELEALCRWGVRAFGKRKGDAAAEALARDMQAALGQLRTDFDTLDRTAALAQVEREIAEVLREESRPFKAALLNNGYAAEAGGGFVVEPAAQEYATRNPGMLAKIGGPSITRPKPSGL